MATALLRGAARDESDSEPEHRPPSRLLVAILVAALVLPLAVAVIAFHKPTWTPVLDLAQTELRVRDVGTSHTPLIGLPGRISSNGHQGSHPGPLSFYALAPTYRLFGSSAFALQLATLMVHALAVAVALLIARRRGGPGIVLGVAALMALLIAGFGVTTLTEPWNPYLPLLWWVVVLLAAWSVLCGDIRMLPVAVVAGSFCAQTHVPYLLLCLGMGAVAVVGAAVLFRRAGADRRRSIVVWGGSSAALGVLLWLPPTIDQLVHDPGNDSILIDHFTHVPEGEQVLGATNAVRVVLRNFDVGHLFVDQLAHPGLLVSVDPSRHVSSGRGAVVLLAWALTAIAALRLRPRPSRLLWLHAVTAVGVVLVWFDISRIFGFIWYYLLLPVWAVTAFMTIAAGWTLALLIAARLTPERRAVATRIAHGALALVVVVFCARIAWSAPSAAHSDDLVVSELRAVVPGTVDALERRVGGTDGHAGRYLVSWTDSAYIGSPGYGLLNELDRRGYDVGVSDGLRVTATAHRVLNADEATTRVALATGVWIDRWRSHADVTEVAYVDPRTDAQRARFEQLRAEVIALFHQHGFDDLIPQVDDSLFGVAINSRVSAQPDVEGRLSEMLSIGVPMAVFIAPPGLDIGL